MYLSVKLQNEDEIRLQPIKDSSNTSEDIYDLVNNENHPLIKLKLDSNTKKLVILEKDPLIAEDNENLNSKLDELLLELIESEQTGTEENESNSIDENPYDPDKIRVETKPFSLRQIFDMIEDNDIDLSPDFQRNFVWDNQRKSRLIESILLRIPLPMFYFSQDENGKLTVVDGLQRLSTIRDFMNNKLKLKDLEYLDNCENKFYDSDPSIEPKYYRWFNMTQITVNVIDPSSPSKVKYDIFRRLNTGGKPLNSQEIRNCLSSILLRDTLRKMITLDSFKTATLGSVKDVRMQAQELALRFIYFHKIYQTDNTLLEYNGKIDTELDDLTDEISKSKTDNISNYIILFDNAMQNAEYLFGRYAFRKCKEEHISATANQQLINKALFVASSVLLSNYDPQIIKANNNAQSLSLPLAQRISGDNDLFLFLTYSTNSKANMQAIFNAVKDIINQNIKLL